MLPPRSALVAQRALARSASPRLALQQQQARSAHYVNRVPDNMPFKYRGPGQSKTKVALKVGSFFGIGFSIPFGIAYYQMKKAGAM